MPWKKLGIGAAVLFLLWLLLVLIFPSTLAALFGWNANLAEELAREYVVKMYPKAEVVGVAPMNVDEDENGYVSVDVNISIPGEGSRTLYLESPVWRLFQLNNSAKTRVVPLLPNGGNP